MKKYLYYLTFLLTGFLLMSSFSDADVEVCPGKGETCKVTKNGIGNPFDKSKGKNDSAIVIKL